MNKEIALIGVPFTPLIEKDGLLKASLDAFNQLVNQKLEGKFKDTYALASALSQHLKTPGKAKETKPTMIIFAEGGIEQNIVANVNIDVYILDEDLYACDLTSKELFKNRHYPVEVMEGQAFKDFLYTTTQDWNRRMRAHPSFIKNKK